MAYDNTNRGVAFTNDKKGNAKAPDWTGKINVEGKDFKLAEWVSEDKNGKMYHSFKLTKLEEKKEVTESADNGQDEEIPF